MIRHRFLERFPEPMETHDRAEGPELKPAGEQLMEGRVVDIASMKAPDIRRPPWNPGESHIQSGTQLISERAEGGINVSGPHQRAVFLRSRPGAAKQIHDIGLPLLRHSLIGHAGIFPRIDIPDLQICTLEIPIMLILVSCEFRLRLIQPENPDSLLIIVFFDFLPHIVPRVRTGDIDQRRVSQLSDSFSPL